MFLLKIKLLTKKIEGVKNMKKKFNLWLNIVTVCLCVCAIAIGVYAAQSATLSVTGSVGFTAHDCEVNVKVYKYGQADGSTEEAMKNGSPVTKVNRVDVTSGGSISVSGTSVAKNDLLGVMYFSDMGSIDNKPADIVIDFELENLSKFNVVANVSSVTCGDSIASTQTTAVVLNKSTDSIGKTGTISVSLSLKPNSSGEYDDLSTKVTVSIELEFKKTDIYTNASVKTGTASGVKTLDSTYANAVATAIGNANCCYDILYEQEDRTYNNYAQAFPYYIEMGSKSGEPIKWLVVGKQDSNGAVIKLEDTDRQALSNGFMLASTNYCLLSEKGLEERNFNSSSTNSKYGTNANDYASSSIREYLKDDFTKTYLISEEQTNSIVARSIANMYATDTIRMSYSDDGKEYETEITPRTVPTSTTDVAIDETDDKFWLLSQTEILTIFEDDTYICSDDDFRVFMSGRTTMLDNTSVASWWLRSPFDDVAYRARRMVDTGVSYNGYVVYTNALRVAFYI